MTDVKFTVNYKAETYVFDYGVKAYIFHTGIYWELDDKYGLDVLLEYTDYIFDCYISDSNRTPVGALADYIAEHWERYRNVGVRTALDDFYIHGDY